MFGIVLLFKDQLPFAVIGSDRYVTVSGKPVLGRKTKWGLIEGENCMNKLADFLVLSNWPEFMYSFAICIQKQKNIKKI